MVWRAAGWTESKLDANAGAGQHVDESRDAEQVDLSAYQIADPGLRDSKEVRGGVLRQLACLGTKITRYLESSGIFVRQFEP